MTVGELRELLNDKPEDMTWDEFDMLQVEVFMPETNLPVNMEESGLIDFYDEEDDSPDQIPLFTMFCITPIVPKSEQVNAILN
jgi:hypothetical protein